MIRFLQQSGQATKYVLGGLLLIICASMVITLIPGGLGGEVFGMARISLPTKCARRLARCCNNRCRRAALPI